jgi:hypothetical protein
MHRALGLAAVSLAACLIGLSFPLKAGRPPPTAQELALARLQQHCSEIVGTDQKGASTEAYAAYVACLTASPATDIESFRAVAVELKGADTATLSIYQFSDGLCRAIDCHGLSIDKVRSLVASEITSRSDNEKDRYSRISTLTGTFSALIATISLCISALTYRRTRSVGVPPITAEIKRPDGETSAIA